MTPEPPAAAVPNGHASPSAPAAPSAPATAVPEAQPDPVRLKRLELHGFKTFATRAHLEFAPGITAIVGPNGSGKSNVADAVRWVLGEQSLRLLRARRLEDVVFGGGAGRAPLGLAEIHLTLDNGGGTLPPGFPEVVVGRRAFRSGESEYFLNKSRVRLRDVVDLLSRAGIGQNGHSVIGQGLVDLALSLRPEERRGLFEDAAGLRRFQAKKDEAEAKLAEAHTNATRAADLIAELEPRVQQLQRQARRAQEEARLRAEWQEVARAALAHQRWELEDAVGQWQPEVDRLTALQRQAQQDAGRAAAASEEGRTLLEAARQRQASAGRARAELQQTLEAARRALAVERERQAAAARLLADARTQAERAHQRLAAAQEETPRAADAAARAEQALAGARNAATAAQQALQQRASAGSDDAAALQAARQRAAETASALTQTVTRHREAEQQRVHLVKQQAEASAGRQRAEELLRTTTEARAALGQAAGERATALQSLRGSLQETTATRAAAQRSLDALSKELIDLDHEVGALSARADVLRRVMAGPGQPAGQAAAQDRAGRSQPTTSTPPTQPTEAPTLASLLEVPPELEAAVAAAAGPALNALVVEGDDAAADLARASAAAGSARFTIVSITALARAAGRLPPAGDPPAAGASPSAAGSPAVLGPLSSLLPGGAGNAGVRAALGDAVVVRDLDAALALARQPDGDPAGEPDNNPDGSHHHTPDRPRRIVTLAGETIDPLGVITVGAAPGEAALLQRQRELRETESRLESLHQRRAPLEAQGAAAQAAVRDAATRTQQLEAELRALQQRESREEGERRALLQQQARAEKDLAWWQEFEQRASSQLASVDQRLLALAAGRDQAQAAHDAARADLEERQTAAQARETDLAALRDRAAAAQTAAAVAEQRLSQAVQHAAMAEATATTVRTDLAGAERRLSRLTAEAATLDQSVANHTAALAEHERAAAAAEQEAHGARQELERAQAYLEKQRALAEAAHSQGTQAERDLALLEARRATLVERVRALQEQAARDLGELPPAQDAGPEAERLAQRMTQIQDRLRALGPVNQVAMQEHAEASERLAFMRAQLKDLAEAQAALELAKADLEAGVQRDFGLTFQAVAEHFRTYFRRLFNGGDARLQLTDPSNLAQSGVEIVAQLPGKRRQELAMLSGGERALVAAALLFALLKARPSPFCVLDEVDAALDEANVGRFCDILEELSLQTQFVVITHNRATMERADALYGVTLGDDGVSHVVSLRLQEALVSRNGATNGTTNGAAHGAAGSARSTLP